MYKKWCKMGYATQKSRNEGLVYRCIQIMFAQLFKYSFVLSLSTLLARVQMGERKKVGMIWFVSFFEFIEKHAQ